jgi:flagellar protein FlgJ
MFDQQIATQISRGKGLGLADMLVQQLMRNSASAAAAPAANTTSAPAAAAVGPAAVTPAAVAPAATQPPTTMSWPPATKADFVQALLPAATAAGQKLGVDPQTLIAHAALETGWGKNMPRNADGSCSFNLFGIKAGSSWQGPVTNSATTEFRGGVAARETASFRSYASPEACLNDYAAMLASKPRYGAALGTGSDVTAFASGLQRGGYATDPQYISKLSAVARQMQGSTPEAIIARGLT